MPRSDGGECAPSPSSLSCGGAGMPMTPPEAVRPGVVGGAARDAEMPRATRRPPGWRLDSPGRMPGRGTMPLRAPSPEAARCGPAHGWAGETPSRRSLRRQEGGEGRQASGVQFGTSMGEGARSTRPIRQEPVLDPDHFLEDPLQLGFHPQHLLAPVLPVVIAPPADQTRPRLFQHHVSTAALRTAAAPTSARASPSHTRLSTETRANSSSHAVKATPRTDRPHSAGVLGGRMRCEGRGVTIRACEEEELPAGRIIGAKHGAFAGARAAPAQPGVVWGCLGFFGCCLLSPRLHSSDATTRRTKTPSPRRAGPSRPCRRVVAGSDATTRGRKAAVR